jgi:hypothetical protein
VGGQREWAVVFADHLPLERRAEDVGRLVAKAELVVVHDSQVGRSTRQLGTPGFRPTTWASLPTMSTGGAGGAGRQGDCREASWDGRRTKTYISMSNGEQGAVYTTLIQVMGAGFPAG